MNDASNSKSVMRKWNIVNNSSKANYDAGIQFFYNTEVRKSNLCNYSDAYILVKSDISAKAAGATQVALKNCSEINICITEDERTTIYDIEGLDLVMLMYNLRKYSSNYTETTRILWFYFENKATDLSVDIENTDNFKTFRKQDQNIEKH